MDAPLRIFVGYDGAEDRAYLVCAKSILRRASIPVQIIPLRQDMVRALGLYWRPRDPLSSTEFSFSRFLVPTLAGFHGPALFMDADFLVLADVAELMDYYDPFYAVQVVQHDYQPTETHKMGGLPQALYPRKNWSSLMLLNTGHPDCFNLTPHVVNTQTGAFLHRFQWCHDEVIGALPEAWNWLEGTQPLLQPKAVHYTRGVPTIHAGQFAYADEWIQELNS